MPAPEKFELTIPSDTTVAQEVQERIVTELESRGFTSRDVFGVRLAMEEAITNAIRHGNKNSPDLVVKIACEISDDVFTIVVEDEGPGFKPDEVPDPTEDENLDLPGGRGVLLINAYMTSVTYNDRGNRVTLVKERTTD